MKKIFQEIEIMNFHTFDDYFKRRNTTNTISCYTPFKQDNYFQCYILS